MRFIYATLFVVAAATILVGCGKKPETKGNPKPIKIKRTPAKTQPDEQISFTEPDKEKTERQKAAAAALQKEIIPVPDSLPKDLVLPKDAHVMTTKEESGTLELTYQTQTPTDELIASCKKGMAEKGWKFVRIEDDGLAKALAFQKDDRRVQMDITSIDGETTVIISTKAAE